MASFGIGRFGAGALAIAGSAVLLAGCSSSGSSTASTASAGAGALTARSTAIGSVLVDSAGHTVYELAGNTAAHQTCTGSCQAIWPPVIAHGSQVVVNGHPAFTFLRDTSPGQTAGQGVQDQWGHWWALAANGTPLTTSSSAPTSSASSSSGGYKY